jgi:hypothetical protein
MEMGTIRGYSGHLTKRNNRLLVPSWPPLSRSPSPATPEHITDEEPVIIGEQVILL